MVCTYDGLIIFSLKKEEYFDTLLHGCILRISEKRPVTKSQMPYNSTYMSYLKFSEILKTEVE